MSDNSSLLAMEGQIVPRSFSPGLVVLSYVVSWIGAWTTLELINKRTAGRGLYNWYDQLSQNVFTWVVLIFIGIFLLDLQ
jgi:Na+/proline symporter